MRTDPGAHADPAVDAVAVDGRPIGAREPHVYILLNKPRGCVTSRRDPEGRPVVLDLLPPGLPRVYPVGRLDYDVEGLLLLTNDGELANRLLHPRYQIRRVYEAEVTGGVAVTDLPRWRRGVVLADGPAMPAAVALLRRGRDSTWLRLTFTEGRHREVKRFCQAFGHPVRRLRRVAFGPLALGSLGPGRWRTLTPGERAALNRLRGGDPSPIMRGIC